MTHMVRDNTMIIIPVVPIQPFINKTGIPICMSMLVGTPGE